MPGSHLGQVLHIAWPRLTEVITKMKLYINIPEIRKLISGLPNRVLKKKNSVLVPNRYTVV